MRHGDRPKKEKICKQCGYDPDADYIGNVLSYCCICDYKLYSHTPKQLTKCVKEMSKEENLAWVKVTQESKEFYEKYPALKRGNVS